jgi:hypothetical protein
MSPDDGDIFLKKGTDRGYRVICSGTATHLIGPLPSPSDEGPKVMTRIKSIYIRWEFYGYSEAPFLVRGPYSVSMPHNQPILAPAMENRLVTATGRRSIEMYVDPTAHPDFSPHRTLASGFSTSPPFVLLSENDETDNGGMMNLFRMSIHSVYTSTRVAIDFPEAFSESCHCQVLINSEICYEVKLDEPGRHFSLGPLYDVVFPDSDAKLA